MAKAARKGARKPAAKSGQSKSRKSKSGQSRSGQSKSGQKSKSNFFTDLVTSDTGRLILAEALIAAATAAAAVLRRERSAEEAVGEGARDLGQAAASALAQFVTDAARSLMPGQSSKSSKT